MTDLAFPEADDLSAWRARLLHRMLRITALASVLPCALISVQAVREGAWVHAALCCALIALLAVLALHQALPYRTRAFGGALLLYLFGLWLLARGAAVGMLYLLTFPVMVALVMELRVALLALAASALTLGGVGWWRQLPVPMVIGLPGDSLLRWLTISSNLMLVGLLMTLAAGFLLRQLNRSMAGHKHSAALLRDVATQVPGMVFRLRLQPGRKPQFLFASPGAQQVLDVPAAALVADAGVLCGRAHAADLPQLQALVQALQQGASGPPTAAAGQRHALELRVHTPEGGLRWLEVQATEVERSADAVVLNGVVTDVSARKRAEEDVQRQAYVDPLTGLHNRLALQTELARLLAADGPGTAHVALLLVDLDRFKEVNDTRGHAGGDELLVQVGRRLQACVGAQGLVARAGGDEFVLLLPALPDDAAAEALGQRVLHEMARAFTVQGQQACVSASLGLAIHPQDGRDADELLGHADQALYEAKGSGRNRCCRYTRALHERAQRRMQLAQALRLAVERGELSLVYQPIVDLRSGQVHKAEALLRWQHPELGAVSPAEFVPIAESTGLIGEIGAWVLGTAGRQAQHWRATLDPTFRVCVNQSPLQFRSELAPVPSWQHHLASLGVPGEALVVEITEGLLLDHSEAVARQLGELRAAGVQVALDDFGTGYSALAYLHRLEIDLLKIDRSFVSGSAAGSTGRLLCRAMVALAQELGLQVVAEGVETEEQGAWLRDIGCHQAQGWLYARGMPPAEFERWYGSRQAAGQERQAEPA